MPRKRFPTKIVLLLALIVGVSSFSILTYTGLQIGSTPPILVGHFGQTSSTTYTYISILNKGSASQAVTVKLWGRNGSFRDSTNRTIEPNAQWQLALGGPGIQIIGRDWDGHFTIESADVSKLLAQAYIIFPNAGNQINFPITISRWPPSVSTETVFSEPPPSTITPASTPPTATGPDTTLTSTPRSSSISTSASFSFTSSQAGSTFECKLDTGSFGSCTSPKTYTGLTRRTSHIFSVRARDAAGNVDPTPATYTWSII